MNRGRGGNRGSRSGGSGWRGRSPRSADRYGGRNSSVGARSGDPSSTPGSGSTRSWRRTSEIASVDGVTQKFNDVLTSDHPRESNSEIIGVGNITPVVGNSKQVQNVHESEQAPKLFPSQSGIRPDYHDDFPSLSNQPVLGTRATQMVQSRDEKEENCKEDEPPQTMGSSFQAGQLSEGVQSGNSEESKRKVEPENTHMQNKGLSFDICEERNINIVKLKAPLHVKNRAMRNETKRRLQGENIKVLRPGMFLLKRYLTPTDQVKLIKLCRDLGQGPGGFYQPGYRDGATLHLKMMCLGRHWDPETSTYHERRPIDAAKPPPIPAEFLQLVKRAFQECHEYSDSHSKGKNAKSAIPSMSPDICIINFYTKTGRLGLHQDKDESRESLDKGLPVVSFSLGDSAEFLYGDQRDIDKADKVLLESGDVLIFGGESRHIFHGVSSINPDTAPKDLLEETNLKPGRVNLTFRQY